MNKKGKSYAERYHDISCGHRVVGHETKCKYLHGHNYRFHFRMEADELDSLGMVVDFGVIKSKLCEWLENNFDHKTLIWENDPKLEQLMEIFPSSIFITPFNPTAENIAEYMVQVIALNLFSDSSVRLVECRVEETRKCSAIYKLIE